MTDVGIAGLSHGEPFARKRAANNNSPRPLTDLRSVPGEGQGVRAFADQTTKLLLDAR